MSKTIKLSVTKLEGFEASVGLLTAQKAHPVYFQTHFGIHTFFMQFAIDVLILDKKMRVVRLHKNLQPNRIFMWSIIYYNVIELPVGEIHRLQIKRGDKLDLKVTIQK